MKLATKIRVLRAIKQWSQKKLAEVLKADWTSISAWENGKRFPHYATAKRLEGLHKEAMETADNDFDKTV